jgi:enoyl-CoA hydratase
MDENSPGIVTEFRGSIAIVRFNRPAERNPLSVAILQELQNTLSALTSRIDITALIFTGTEDVFLSGADIRELALLEPDAASGFSKLGQDVFQTIADSGQITIAAINGYCMGGGLDLALACDVRIASKTALFSHPGARLGIITGWGGTQRLPQIIGRARALELFASASILSVSEALAFGLISEIATPVLVRALEFAKKFHKQKAPEVSPAPS